MNKVKKFLYSQKAAPYVFILPFVLTVILFWVFPIANGVLLSFQDVLKDKWVGMNNYKRLLSDTYFRKAVWNSFKYMVGTLVLLIPFPMLFASMLNSKLMKAKGFFKSVYFIPALTSVVVVGTIFRLMFGEMDTALANQILNFFGHSSIKWLKGEWTGYFALLLVACWRWTGVNILYFLAGLQNISTDLYEAASIDGATSGQVFFKITLPLLMPILLYVAITSLIGGLQMFDVPQIITSGSGKPQMSCMTLIMYLNRVIGQGSKNYGLGGAISVVIFIITGALSMIVFKSMINTGDKPKKAKKVKGAAK